MKKTRLNSVDYDAIAVDDILDIHKYLMNKNNMIYKFSGFTAQKNEVLH